MSDPVGGTGQRDTRPPVPPDVRESVWEDFIDIFHSPTSVFRRRQNAGFAIPLLIVAVLMAVLFFASRAALQPILDADFERAMQAAMQRFPELTEEQFAQDRHMAETLGLVGFVVLYPVIVIVTGVGLWLVGRLFQAQQTITAAVLVATYAQLPRLLKQLAATIQGYLIDPARLDSWYDVSLGLARFLDHETVPALLMAMAARVEVFIIWSTILLGIGLSVTGNIPRSRAFVAAFVLWVLGGLVSLAGAAP